nr:Chain P, Synthetic octapeptide WEHI 1886493 [synthetic construct]7ZLJ_P Chain P, synthetic octapeptide WEHI 1886493 [synthetic construct]
GSWAKWS